MPDAHAIGKDAFYEMFFRAWGQLSLQQQKDTLQRLESMFLDA